MSCHTLLLSDHLQIRLQFLHYLQQAAVDLPSSEIQIGYQVRQDIQKYQ